MKKVFIINGMAESGKDTFVSFLNEFIPVKHISIVDKVKDTATKLGWKGEKTEKDRKFLSDIKLATDSYDDRNYKYIEKMVKDFKDGKLGDCEVLCIDMREKNQIKRALKDFDAKSVLVYRPSAKHITSNIADANVFNMQYDIIVHNKGTLEDLKNVAKLFVDKHIKNEEKKEDREEDFYNGYYKGIKDIVSLFFNL